MGAIWHPSSNYGPRRNGARPELIVLHYTGMHSTAAALQRLCDPEFQVSAHYLISPQGDVVQMVAEDQRAWHAGAGLWCGKGDVNSRSIGIELANRGDMPFPNPQMTALESLLGQIMARWQIAAVDVIAHSDMAPDRKEDPGARFDWRRLALQGLALWPEGQGTDRPLGPSLDAIGYPDAASDKRLQAFRLRFRPWGQGPECAQDRMRASAVADGFSAARR
ncbi:N-acetylmuramoyl-L-alanine amidase [Roseinatronobacter alkalisoli]|uniref:N-acetylmuramoyl-L-alanine amidase n=1 Tax=Roseinatronobacter alkalisoli TaxID=3028235 RepID=A0ABT5T9C6_9RHOB|nr:N-acetylmuramoyl-L-alanine amidase [Roseinatronobacter sp. HJB301]MDD7971723.1 N-acetylmuramoyl-L-alanine amidase [Roseinatronobacter sp. HJB301]